MASIGIDSSVFIRLLTGEPEGQVAIVIRKIEEFNSVGAKLFASDFVIYESALVLKNKYHYDGFEIAGLLLDIFRSGTIHPEKNSSILDILQELMHVSNPGLADRIIQKNYLRYCEKILTFDKKMSNLEGVELL